VELLPYKNLCLEKYKALNLPFPLEATPPMRAEEIAKLEKVLESVL
jgi:pyruvate formate lyase activating enzyme